MVKQGKKVKRYLNYKEIICVLRRKHREYYAGMQGRELSFTGQLKDAKKMEQWEADMKILNWPSVNFTKVLLK